MALTLIAFALVALTPGSKLTQSQPILPVQYATTKQVNAWLNLQKNGRIIVSTDPREAPIRLRRQIPESWLQRSAGERSEFKGTAQPGEFYVFQISIYNNGQESVDIRSVEFSGFPKSVQTTCLNQAVSLTPSRNIKIPAGQIQPLWIGVESKIPGEVTGDIRVATALGESGQFVSSNVHVAIQFAGSTLPNSGVDEGWRLARLKWLLPSDLGEGPEPTKGYRAVVRKGRRIEFTASALTIDKTGLPAQIESNSVAHKRLLKAPAKLNVITDKSLIKWASSKTTFDDRRDDCASWQTENSADSASLLIQGKSDFDGFVRYHATLTAKNDLELKDVNLEVPYREESAPFQLGLGFHGGYTPTSTDWKWNVAFQQDCVWLGDVPIGAQWRFKGSNYQRPLVNIYYGFRPLNLPDSWGNFGQGGIRVDPANHGIRLLTAYSGSRKLLAGQALAFNFDLQITPSRPIDTDKQWATRFYHPNELSEAAKIDQAVDTAKQAGATVINVHHRKPVNPFINYPFNDFSVPDLKHFVDSAHKQDIRVKIYYTTRELTWQLPEIWALKSFGDSIIEPGPGPNARTVINPNGAHPMLTESLEDNFIPAWTATLDGKYAGKLDLAVITRPDSAWTNYYLNGLDWLVKNVHIDGTYIDDTALDRESLQRARRILEAGRPNPLIDLHSWNHEDPLAARGSSTSIYMELFPYIDRIWLGEGFDYINATPDYWLVAMSGIPYGVMSEMLQGGGNIWRGMLFGETCRLGWSGDPRSMWQFWDRFGMAGTRMVGWWDPTAPVKTNSNDVLATVYLKHKKALVAIANWTNADRAVKLAIDWKALGIDSASARISAEAIEGFQQKATWKPDELVSVPGGKGWVITIE